MQKLDITQNLFGRIYPYVIDDNVTDIKWNGKTLWINDLNKGRYIAKDKNGKDIVLDDRWLSIFTTNVANSMNVNFNMSMPSLQAETDELRIHAVHKFVSGEEKYALAIRKTPSVSRLANRDLLAEGYVDELTNAIMPTMIRARMSGCVIGDVGSGKTELEKYLCAFIPEVDGIITVEDTLEMKLPKLYPHKDIYSLKVDNTYTAVEAIRDALRLLTKWLILSEARGREIVQVMEAASTGCVAMTSIHAENTWEIPDRMLNMAGNESREGFENDIYTFFDYAIKVKATVTGHGIFRKVDQISFFDREDGKNTICVFYKDGKLTGEQLPRQILERLTFDKNFVDLYNKYFHTNVQVREDMEMSEILVNDEGEFKIDNALENSEEAKADNAIKEQEEENAKIIAVESALEDPNEVLEDLDGDSNKETEKVEEQPEDILEDLDESEETLEDLPEEEKLDDIVEENHIPEEFSLEDSEETIQLDDLNNDEELEDVEPLAEEGETSIDDVSNIIEEIDNTEKEENVEHIDTISSEWIQDEENNEFSLDSQDENEPLEDLPQENDFSLEENKEDVQQEELKTEDILVNKENDNLTLKDENAYNEDGLLSVEAESDENKKPATNFGEKEFDLADEAIKIEDLEDLEE